jgi:YD repeat-containing protein
VFGEKAHYFYDKLGRLQRVVSQGGEGAVYHYDAVGNLISTSQDTTEPQSPALSYAEPGDVFINTSITLTIKGDNLLTTKNVSIPVQGVAVNHFEVIDDSTVSASVTIDASAPTGPASLEVASIFGTSVIDMYIHEILVDPGTVYLGEGDSASIEVQLSGPVTWEVVVPVINHSPGVVSVPSYITVPAGGSVELTAAALQVGSEILDVGGTPVNIFVTPAFAGDASIGSVGVCVSMTAIPTGSLINSRPVSVQMMSAPDGTAVSRPVSVDINN